MEIQTILAECEWKRKPNSVRCGGGISDNSTSKASLAKQIQNEKKEKKISHMLPKERLLLAYLQWDRKNKGKWLYHSFDSSSFWLLIMGTGSKIISQQVYILYSFLDFCISSSAWQRLACLLDLHWLWRSLRSNKSLLIEFWECWILVRNFSFPILFFLCQTKRQRGQQMLPSSKEFSWCFCLCENVSKHCLDQGTQTVQCD